QQPQDAQDALDDECEALGKATSAASTLTNNPPPTLETISTASFSASYRAAQQQDAAFDDIRTNAQTLIGAISDTLGPLATFCANFRAGVAIEVQAALRDSNELAPLRTMNTGDVMTIDNVQVTCQEALGCVNYANEEDRKAYAAAWRSIQEERMEAMIAHYRDECWLDELGPYCTLMSSAWDETKSGVGAVASAIDSLQVNDEPGQPPFPRLTAAEDEMDAAFQQLADRAKIEAGNVDQPSLSDVGDGWETRMMVRLTTKYEARLQAAVANFVAAVS
ncbi:MAG: hypothetical protein ACTH31_16480, partial [Pseudoclavibacter sp.]